MRSNVRYSVVESGSRVIQETVGWNDTEGYTFSQRNKEEAHDYRYFPEPDLPPLVIEPAWLEQIRQGLPELPERKVSRFIQQYGLTEYDARVLAEYPWLADYYEAILTGRADILPKTAANWVTGELLGLMNNANLETDCIPIPADHMAGLIRAVDTGQINLSTAKNVLEDMFKSGKDADQIIREKGHSQIVDESLLNPLSMTPSVRTRKKLPATWPGRKPLANWFFGQVMRAIQGQAYPQPWCGRADRQMAGRHIENQISHDRIE